MDKYINTPITEETTKDLHSGDYVYITGTIYVARDAAHKRMIEALDSGENLPIDIKDSTIYYMGPSPAREGRPIGSAGPTTATRMDKYAPTLLDLGAEAIRKLYVENFPAIVVIDRDGNNLYETAIKEFCELD